MYRENLIGAIYASDIENPEELVSVVESATTIEELDAVEEIIVEAGGSLPGPVEDIVDDYSDLNVIEIDTESTISKIIDTLEKNKNVVIASSAAAAVIGGFAGVIAKIKSTDPKIAALKKEAKELEREAKDLKKACDSGEISELKCKMSLLVISKKAKAIQKKIETLKKSAKPSAKKESVNLTVAIFEAAMNGSISSEERDHLLDLISE